jgi:hypothetical protein
MCRSGHYVEGELNARKAYESSVKAFGPKAGLTGGTASTLAACLIGLNRLDEASKLLDQIDIAAVSQLAGDPDWGAGVTILQAEVAYRRHDYLQARKLADAVTPVFTRDNAEAYQRNTLQTLQGELAKAQN